MDLNIDFTVKERFLSYVRIDTQSDPDSKSVPSTEKQKNLGKLLVSELLEIGITDAEMDEWGYVYATIPSTVPFDVPVICFCSHMDTSPDCSGTNVNPVIHSKYAGGVIKISDTLVLDPAVHINLLNQTGNDIITSDGTTLLGADNKAGIAEIMDAAAYLIKNPQIPHGKIRILFTPDEEIGRGVDKVNLEKLGASFAYTMDGEDSGTIEDETFSADLAIIEIEGVSAHPGFAKGKMESAIRFAGNFINDLPFETLSPENTSDKEGFIHPVSISGGVEHASIKLILRDFEANNLKTQKELLLNLLEKTGLRYPNSKYTLEIVEQYRNMKSVLNQFPFVVEYAEEAIRRAGMNPQKKSIRGGTDGSRLSFMGLPCPNIFAGEHAFHSRIEWVSVQDMQKAVETIIHLAIIWAEKSKV